MKKQLEPKKKRLDLKDETKQGVLAVIAGALAIFFLLASTGIAGAAGRILYRAGMSIFGYGYFLFPMCLILLGISFLRPVRPNIIGNRLIGGLILFFGLLGLITVIFPSEALVRAGGNPTGGKIGYFISLPLLKLFDTYISILFLGAVIVIATLIVFDTSFTLQWTFFGRPINAWWSKKKKENLPTIIGEVGKVEPWASESKGSTLPTGTANLEVGLPSGSPTSSPDDETGLPDGEAGFGALIGKLARRRSKTFEAPPLSILERDTGKPGAGDIKGNTTIIKRTLQNFGIIVEMDEVSIGPSITRYALKPAEGVKLSRIVALQNDLSLALAAHPLRIEAPIPGRSLVGIEIPNNTKSIVGLASILASRDFVDSPHSLLVSLGRGISGPAHFGNLAKAPHFLIAGATGSGKSVVIHTFIVSLLYRNPPESLRIIMIDPKRVELTIYNKTPHLLTPVITDPKKAILALKWAIKEMERRYVELEKHHARDILSYNQTASETDEAMPYIVIVIDELADIMATYPRELEAAIVRLAQMSRAVGIHLILSTQRPSVEIITGLIKANIPSRIALQVASQIDSRTILDMGGAEKLLGAGDMLYLAGDMSKPLRLQSAFISEREVKEVVKWLAAHYGDELGDEIAIGESDSGITIANDESGADTDDPLYEEARALVLETGKASATFLQRRLKIGYARAARILDMLEEHQVVGPGEGAKTREVFGRGESVTDAMIMPETTDDYDRAN
ncbi:MAG: DNA translocase FtsK 4TM domain-containing protein [Candidatus Vogelbacteria bacterium]